MSYCKYWKSCAGVGVVWLGVMWLAPSRGGAANFDSVQLNLPAPVTSSMVDFSLNPAVTGATALFYFEQEFSRARQDWGVYPVDSGAAPAAFEWAILWQPPALIPVSAVPEPTTATLVLAAAALLARRRRVKRTADWFRETLNNSVEPRMHTNEHQ